MKNIKQSEINKAAQKANIDLNSLKSAAQEGNVEQYIAKNLPKQTSEQILKILNDKSATEKILSSPQGKELLKKFSNK